MNDADDLGRFGVARTVATVAERLPPLQLVGWTLVAVGVALLGAGLFLPWTPLAVLGGLLVLPGAALLVLGYRRGALGVDTQ